MRESKNSRSQGLGDLLSHDCHAKDFYLTLPEDAQGLLQQHTSSIRSLEDMHRFTSGLHQPPHKSF